METTPIDHPDHLGSTTVITNHLGQVVQLVPSAVEGRLSYKPFGGFNGPAPSDGSAIHHFFTGQELDTETSFYHLGARYYDARRGQFTQADPLIEPFDPQANSYAYARNNPLRLVDPTGLSFHSGFGGLGGGFGGGGFGGGLGGGVGTFRGFDLTRSLQSLSWSSQQSWNNFTSGRLAPVPPPATALPSLTTTTTLAMQDFSRSSSLTPPSFRSTGFGGPLSDPFRASGSFSVAYRQVTTPGFGTTTTLLSGSFPAPSQPILPQTPFLNAFQQTTQTMLAVERQLQPVTNFLLTDPARLLGWSGTILRETGYPLLGQALRVADYSLSTAGPFEKVGGIVGGTIGTTVGRIAFSPVGLGTVGAIGGSVVFGYAGSFAGQLADELFGF